MYAKVFRQMYEGSLATVGPWEAMVTFQQFLVLADRYGDVDMTPEVIARLTTIPLAIISTGIAVLAQPDPDSRTPDAEGRRLVPIDPNRAWGWSIVNYAKYAAIRSAEERRAYKRRWISAKRKSTPVDNVDTVGLSDSDSYSDSEREGGANAPTTPKRSTQKKRRGVLSHRVPEGFEVADELAEWAKREFPALDLYGETQKFRDYEFDKPRSDWPAAWRNWMRRAAERPVGGSNGRR